jgi:hypothetical protein
MVDKSNHFISKAQVRSLIRGNLKVSSDMVFRHALKEDFSNYRSNIIVQNGNSEVAIKAAQALANYRLFCRLFRQLLIRVCRYKWLWQNPE